MPFLWVCQERKPPPRGRDLHAELAYLRAYSRPIEEFLREAKPRGMVCIGGGQEMTRQYEIFRKVQPKGRVYALPTTGGVAATLAKREPEGVRAMDEVIQSQIEIAERELERRLDEETREREPVLVPYPLIMQELVAELGGSAQERERT